MPMSGDLREQIWLEDILDTEDVARETARVLDNFVQRGRAQGAPTTLVTELEVARNLCAEAMDRLQKIKPCFPPEPR
jgi:hypothetical protein